MNKKLTPPVEPLSEEAVSKIEKRLKSWINHEVPHTQYPASWQEVDALCQSLRAARADVEKFSTLADERHDLLSAEKRANDHLRGNLREQRRTITSWQQHVQRLGQILHCPAMDIDTEEAAKKLVTENVALREQLVHERRTIIYWQNHVKRMGKLLGCAAIDGDVETAVRELQSRLAQVEKERDDQVYQAELAQERLQTTVQLALQGLNERCSEVAAVQWFQSEYCFAVEKVRNADEATVFALRKGLPTLTGKYLPPAATTTSPAAQPDDGWVTFGRVKVDIENETETFERISPAAASEGEQVK